MNYNTAYTKFKLKLPVVVCI